MASESSLKTSCRRYMRSLGNTWFFSPVPTGYGRNGVPDDIVCHKGLFFSIEYKGPHKRPTPLQKIELLGIHSAQGCATLAWSLEDVQNLFENGIGIIPDPDGSDCYVRVSYK